MANVLGTLFSDIANAIRSKTNSTDKIAPIDFPTQIESITVGGGTAEDCVTVTFMNGNEVLFARPVYIGDDCPDPVTQGRIETPTKESTVDTVFAYSGWTSADGGTVDSSILNNITEDKVIYSAFAESVRYYTVSFYDGETLLNTEQVAYGQMPSYIPTKSGYAFDGWTPELVECVGDTTYSANWKLKIDFATDDWEAIASVSQIGEAQEHFAIGDTRTETINYNGTSYNVTLKIAGFNHDDLADGSGKAGMTIICHTGGVTSGWETTIHQAPTYAQSDIATALNTLYNEGISEGLKNVIKKVTKTCNYANATSFTTGDFSIFAPSYKECGWDQISTMHSNGCYETGNVYELYQDAYLGSDDMPFDYKYVYNGSGAFSRDAYYMSYYGSEEKYSGVYVNKSDKKIYRTETPLDVIWGFCI